LSIQIWLELEDRSIAHGLTPVRGSVTAFLTQLSELARRRVPFCRGCGFSGIYFVRSFFFLLHQPSGAHARPATGCLTLPVSNDCAKLFTKEFLTRIRVADIDPGGYFCHWTAIGGRRPNWRTWMSLKIAVALSATLAAGLMTVNPVQARPDMVGFRGDYSPGTIVVKTSERRLYLVLDQGRAVRYPVGVGKAGKQWAGTTQIDGKYRAPAWSPPAEVKRDNPSIPDVIPGGSPSNPMGVAAMTLAGGEYAIHGTNRPGSVGGFVSYGCVRMYNEDITDLFERVSVGTPVVVTAR
jgi:hypothetical protein